VKDKSSGARETLPVELAGKINSDSVPYWKFFKSIEIVENRSCRVKGRNESGSRSTAARYSDRPYTPLHRHRCKDVYYVVEGSSELESDGRLHPLSPGCAVLNRSGVKHRVFNTQTIRLCNIVTSHFGRINRSIGESLCARRCRRTDARRIRRDGSYQGKRKQI
jgi:mannose-6-phosphate isomerase-like protein (cupin superfamily)